MRDEADGVIKSIEETLKIGRDTGSAVVISHHKCTMPENFGRSPETLARIDRGASEQTVDFDVYPRSEEHTSELQSLMRISYAVFCLQKKNSYNTHTTNQYTTKHRQKSTKRHRTTQN